MRLITMAMTFTLVCTAAVAPAGAAAVISLDGDWDFTYTFSSAVEIPEIPAPASFEVKVAVPGRWDDQLGRFKSATWWSTAQFTTTIPPVRYLTGIGWYRKRIDVPASWRDRAVLLSIGGAVGTTHVWLNGVHVGRYDYGVYTPYGVDLTSHLDPGKKNELLVAVDNTRGFAGGWAFLGNAGKASGITRSVTLKVSGGPGRIADIYIRPGEDLREVVWQTELEVPAGSGHASKSKLIWDVRTADKDTVLARGEVGAPAFDKNRKLTFKARIDQIKPWTPKQPNLYWTNLRWVLDDGTVWDADAQRFGLRRWSYETRRLKLNGRDIYLRGEFGAYYFPVHCTTPTSKDYWVRHVKRARQIGMNYINFAARVCPIELMEAADELGIILQCGDHMTVLQKYRNYYKGVWTPIVRWTRKYPSLCIYGFGGERNYYEGIIEQYQKQHDLIKFLHPECLVMPQQAIRGIDYAFDEKGRQELTPEPFPHHAERLARYTKACDIFGHYSGGAFGYNYFQTPWREMEKRFLIYQRPLSLHELFMGMSYLNPDNAKKYTGRVPPYLYTKLRDDLTEAGLIDKWRTYHVNSSKLHSICRKYCVEKVRKCNEPAGFEFLGMTDQHFQPHYTTGILDEFLQLKPGDTVEGILRYNGESVLLLDFTGGSINRSCWAEEPFEADIMVSLYGDDPIERGQLSWILKDGDKTVLQDKNAISDVANSRVTTLGRLKLSWPTVDKTTRFNLSVKLTAPGYDIANDWDFWVFPKLDPPKVSADADEKTYTLLGPRYKGVGELTETPAHKLRIVSNLSDREIQHLAAGGDVLLLGTKPFPAYTAWTSFRPGLGARHHHNAGTVIAPHPVFDRLPHDGWGDWHFYSVLEGAPCILFDEDLPTTFDPILEIISSAGDVRKLASIFEKRVGKGRLLVSTCVYRPDNPSCEALMDGILEYVSGSQFRPKDELSLPVLIGLTKPAEPRDPRNRLAAPGFEKRRDVKKAWLQYGGDYEIDDTTAHSGKKSLRLTITPDHRKKKPDYHTGARAQQIRFKKPPRVVKVSAWHKTQDLTGSAGRDFLVFVYITYKDGGQYTLRMCFVPGTHDWQYIEQTWKPDKEIVAATLYVGLARKTGTAWIDDVYFGETSTEPAPAPSRPELTWHRKPVTLDFDSAVTFQINEDVWQTGTRVRVAREGINRVAIKKNQTDRKPQIRQVGIDTIPPVIRLATKPALDQEGGVYFATRDTVFRFEATDKLSGVKTIEISIDGQAHVPYREPLKLPAGRHELRCRAADVAGNRSEVITGQTLSGGKTDALVITVK